MKIASLKYVEKVKNIYSIKKFNTSDIEVFSNNTSDTNQDLIKTSSKYQSIVIESKNDRHHIKNEEKETNIEKDKGQSLQLQTRSKPIGTFQ